MEAIGRPKENYLVGICAENSHTYLSYSLFAKVKRWYMCYMMLYVIWSSDTQIPEKNMKSQNVLCLVQTPHVSPWFSDNVVTEGHQPEDAQGHHHPQIWWQTGDLRELFK